MDFFRFLGFFEKNLKPKNRFLGGKIEKIKTSKDVFGREMKSFREESVLIFNQKLGERGVLGTFKFFSITPFGGPGPPLPLISENSVFLHSSWKI